MALPTLTLQQVIAKLTSPGLSWSAGRGIGATITYSFRTSVSTGYGSGTEYRGFQPFSQAQKAAARLALSRWAELANLDFVEVAGNAGTITFASTAMNPGYAAYAYYPGSYYECCGDVWLNTGASTNTTALYDMGYGAMTLVHEIGHALGLAHPDNYNVGTSLVRRYVQDNRLDTVMSYFDTADYMYSAKPLLYDVAAIQALYGANMNTRAGDTTYAWANNAYFADCLWDAGGNDVIDASNQSRRVVIDLNAGAFSSIGLNRYGALAANNLSVAFGAVLEGAQGGAGNDILTGNAADNTLVGNAGDDTLSGGIGNDTVDGGTGNDVLSGGAGNDTYRVGGTWGSDRITDDGGVVLLSDVVGTSLTFLRTNDSLGITSATGQLSLVNYFLYAGAFSIRDANGLLTLPQLAAMRPASAGNDNVTGCADDDYCDGLAGNDRFIAFQGGDDTLLGGLGNDTFQLGVALTGGDSLDGGGGFDTLQFTDAGTGADDLDQVVGIEQIVLGNAATRVTSRDSLVAAGGLLAVNGAALTAGHSLCFDGAAETDGRFLLAGGLDADSLVGGAGNDTLRGGNGWDTLVSGAGCDSLDGGNGWDTLVCGTFLGGGDTVLGGLGYDTLTFTAASPAALSALQNIRGVERIVCGDAVTSLVLANALVAPGASLVLDASALAADHPLTLTGGAETDGALWVVGGAGNDAVGTGQQADSVFGGAGNDLLATGPGNDTVDGGTGNDDLRAGVGADRLLGSDGDDILYGGLGPDSLLGGAGADTLVGGAGPDWLVGGTGADTFRFTTWSESVFTARDGLADFTTGADKIDLSALHLRTSTSQLACRAAAGAAFVRDYFGVGGQDRAVVYAQTGADALVFVDCNANGNFDAGGDLVFRMANVRGGTAPVIGDFVFT